MVFPAGTHPQEIYIERNAMAVLVATSTRVLAPLFVMTLLLSIAQMPSAGASADGDLYIDSVVVVQVVPEPRAIVVNKSAAIRVTVVNAFNMYVNAEIRVTYNHGTSSYLEVGRDGDGVPLEPGINIVYLPGGGCTAEPGSWTSEPMKFEWTSPGLDSQITAEIDPRNLVEETDETNNVRATAAPVEAFTSRSLRILVVPVYDYNCRWMYPFEFSLDEELGELRDTYPIADDGVSVVEAPPEWIYYPTSAERLDSFTLSHSADARALGYDRVILVFRRIVWPSGVEFYGAAVGVLNEPRDPVPLYVTANGINVREALIAHELGHTYYLWHPHDIGIPTYDATKWSANEKVYDVDANTLMSYLNRLPSGVPETPRWLDRYRYQDHVRSWIDMGSSPYYETEGTWEWNLFSQLVFSPPSLGPIVVIQGTVFKSGLVSLAKPWYKIPNGIADEQSFTQEGPVGNYSVRMLDDSLNELGRTYFDVSFTRFTHHEGPTDYYVSEDVESVDFVVSAPEQPNTRYVQILDPLDNVLAERQVTPAEPNVQLLSPNGMEEIDIGQRCQVDWTADDLDGDELSYFLAYTPDGGDTWIPIASNLTTTSYEWNTTGVAPTAECKVKVMASDGYNTAEDVSDAPFEMSDSSPPTTRMDLEGVLGQNGWYVSPVNISFVASDNSRVSRTEYSFDNSTWSVYVSAFAFPGEGDKTVFYRSKDIAGNLEQVRSTAVKVDVTAPSLVMSSPLSGSSVSGDVVFSWNATDGASGVAKYEVRLNSGAWIDVGDTRQWEGVGVTKGTNKFEVRATDVAGNSAEASVYFDYSESSGVWLLAAIAVAVVVFAVGAALAVLRWRRGKG